jgi:hypothetical protein
VGLPGSDPADGRVGEAAASRCRPASQFTQDPAKTSAQHAAPGIGEGHEEPVDLLLTA